jgi:hypothetical protein
MLNVSAQSEQLESALKVLRRMIRSQRICQLEVFIEQ